MYLSTERAASYPAPASLDITNIRRRLSKRFRRIMIAALGREFMALSATHKLYGFYFVGSLIAAIALWSEELPWLVLLPMANLANAARLVNRIDIDERRDK